MYKDKTLSHLCVFFTWNYQWFLMANIVYPISPQFFHSLCTILTKKISWQYLTLPVFIVWLSVGSPCPIAYWNQCQSATLYTWRNPCFWSSSHYYCLCIYINFCKFAHIGFIFLFIFTCRNNWWIQTSCIHVPVIF